MHLARNRAEVQGAVALAVAEDLHIGKRCHHPHPNTVTCPSTGRASEVLERNPDDPRHRAPRWPCRRAGRWCASRCLSWPAKEGTDSTASATAAAICRTASADVPMRAMPHSLRIYRLDLATRSISSFFLMA